MTSQMIDLLIYCGWTDWFDSSVKDRFVTILTGDAYEWYLLGWYAGSEAAYCATQEDREEVATFVHLRLDTRSGLEYNYA